MSEKQEPPPPAYNTQAPPGYPAGAPPPAAYPPPPAGQQQDYPLPGQYPPPGPQQGYPQPVQQPQAGTTVVVQPRGDCPHCGIGYRTDNYTTCGIILAICFFPLGLICCLLMKESKCSHCGQPM